MISVKEINPLDHKLWLEEFSQSELYRKLVPQFEHIISSYKEMTVLKAALNDTVYERSRDFCYKERILDIVPYYYIQPLISLHPEVIVDLGCGLNIFKNIWTDIIGVDADPVTSYDILDHFDHDYAQGHKEYCDALISINAIHFSSIDSIAERLKWCEGMLKPGGAAFVAFNLETWLMFTDRKRCVELFGSTPQFDDIVNYVDREIRSIGLNFVIYDWPVIRTPSESTIRDDLNGNIRLVFQK